MIRQAIENDIQQICEIYNYYILNTFITFEEEPVSPAEMKNRITEVQTNFPWYVDDENGCIRGYAYASKFKSRSAYRFTVETSVYVKHDNLGKGIGKQLYQHLLAELKNRSIHSAIGILALPNERSQVLHEKLGFVKTGHLHETGFKMNQWIDIGYWELLLDRAFSKSTFFEA